jgi:UDP-glucose 4-epimerase
MDSYYDPSIKYQIISSLKTHKNFSFIEGDIRDKKLLKNVLTDVKYIFHDAAQPGVRFSVDNPMKSHDVNATGTLCLLEAARDAKVNKVINASSSSVYGKVKYLPFDEGHPKTPISPYGVSKLMAEHYCRVFNELYGLKTITLRYFTVYGPRMRPDLAVNIFTGKALKNETIEVFGDGKKTRDFTYIDDIVDANLLAMDKGEGVYNIGGGHFISINELANAIIEITGSSSTIKYSSAIKGDADHTLANSEKARKELGWKPKVEVRHGLKKYIEWYKANMNL